MEFACLTVPNFLVALARRDSPALGGRAVVVGGSPEEHAQVTACSEEAAAAGVMVGTTLRRALALCPNAVFLPLQKAHAAAEAARLADLLKLYSPLVEAVAPGHAHFEVRGLARMAGMAEERWLADLLEVTETTSGLPVRLGAAATVFAAHAAALSSSVTAAWQPADTPNPPIAMPYSRTTLRDQGHSGGATKRRADSEHRPVIVPGTLTRDFLAPLPVEILPISAAMLQRLRLFGLERVGELAKLPFSAIQAQFGPEGARAWSLANGKDDSRIVPAREELRIDEETDLPAPTALSEPLIVGTRALLVRALQRPEARGQPVRRLDWRLGLESGEQITRRFVLREPTNDPARLLFAARGRIERLQLTAAAVSLGVTLSGLCSEYGHQVNLWPIGPRRWKELIEAIEQLNARVGSPQVYRIVEVQPWSRIPERQLGLVQL